MQLEAAGGSLVNFFQVNDARAHALLLPLFAAFVPVAYTSLLSLSLAFMRVRWTVETDVRDCIESARLSARDDREEEMSENHLTFDSQIGSDGGFLPSPVTLSELLLAPAERADLVLFFVHLVSRGAGNTQS